MELIFREAWILFIIVTAANAFMLRLRSKKHIEERPELSDGYEKYFKGILIIGNIPWLIVGIGNISGMTNSIFDYFNPRTLNPVVLAFHGTTVILWILLIYWVYFRNGADFIGNHPGLIRVSRFGGSSDITAAQVKIFLPFMLAGGVVGMVLMWLVEFPTPKI